jgi:hypothetical protein
MEVRRPDWRHAQKKGAFYQCASYLRRGPSVCQNTLALPLERADTDVLDAIEMAVLHPTVVRKALRETIEAMRRPIVLDPSHEAALKEEARHVDHELANLLATVKAAGPLPTLVADLQRLEQRKTEIHRAVTVTPVALRVDLAALEQLLDEWRAMFRSNVPIGRQILRELLAGERVVFTPKPDERRYDFVAPCTLDRISATFGGPPSCVAPGIRTRMARILGGASPGTRAGLRHGTISP